MRASDKILKAINKQQGEQEVTIGGCLAVLVLFIPATIWSALVTSIIWGWFVVPLGVPPIGIAHAIGLTLLIRTTVLQANVATKTVSVEDKIYAWIFGPAFVLLVGWVLTHWM